MPPIKLPGLLALAALLALGLLRPLPAAAAEAVRSVRHVHEVSMGNTTLLTGFYGVECRALFLGDSQSSGGFGTPLTVVGVFTYSGCTAGCVFSEENGPLRVRISKAKGETTATISYFLSHLECPSFANCTYKEGPLRELFRDPSSTHPNGDLSIHHSMVRESGALCPDPGGLDLITTSLEAYLSG